MSKSGDGSTIQSDVDRVVQEVLPLNIKIDIDKSSPVRSANKNRKKK